MKTYTKRFIAESKVIELPMNLMNEIDEVRLRCYIPIDKLVKGNEREESRTNCEFFILCNI